MINNTTIAERELIPIWRDYQTTARQGELNSTSVKFKIVQKPSLAPYLWAWENNSSIMTACDLLSAAIVSGNVDNPQVKCAALFLLSQKEISASMLTLTKEFFSKFPNNTIIHKDISSKLEDLSNKIETRNKIIELKKEINNYCDNAIAYCELARCYTILSQTNKATKAMMNAISLAPNHRYIARSAASFFFQTKQYDIAHAIVSKNQWLRNDPWMLVAEIVLSKMNEKTSRNISLAKKMLESKKYNPFSLSELACELGMLELESGNYTKCKKFFKEALIDPNDNSVSQVEWVSANKRIEINKPNLSKTLNGFEAEMWEAYQKNNYKEAVLRGVDWICDVPFDSRALDLSSWLAMALSRDFFIADKLINRQIQIDNTDATAKNNLAYVNGMMGKCTEADKIIASIKDEDCTEEDKICIYATKGLVEYRKGNAIKGRNLYQQAIHAATSFKDDGFLLSKAILNFLREEVRCSKHISEEDKNIFEHLKIDENKELQVLYKEVEYQLNQI